MDMLLYVCITLQVVMVEMASVVLELIIEDDDNDDDGIITTTKIHNIF